MPEDDMARAELTYLAAAAAAVQDLADTQADAIGRAADAVATAIAADHRVFVASTSHVLHSELVMRAGGLAAVHALGEPPDFTQPMLDLRAGALDAIGPFQPEAGDVVLIGTNAGTDAGTVEVALAARAAGCVVVGLTCVAYESWPDVVRDHPTRGRLMDLSDILIDVGGVVGDGIVELPGLDVALGPTSGVALVAAAWAILVGAAERLLAQGLTPVAYRSVQIPGAEDLFHERRAAYEASGRGVRPSEPAEPTA
jgi:uncharacterized phosphosugar-binding protein